ncbi:MAG: DUF1284 domain-containing protein [Desulfobacterales bacterium]|nr:DUF1284 domain-containing protein [Desulfobacterales bacterium]
MERVKFRAHHIFCERFMKVDLPDGGAEYDQAKGRLRDIIKADDESSVEVCEGVDEICRVCPECRDNRCQSAQGDEEAVRKWDSIILRGLGVSYGETRTSKEWRMLIEQKAPLKFCQTRCPFKERCNVFQLG